MRSPSAPDPWPDLLPEFVGDLGGPEPVARLLRVTPRQVCAWVRAPARAPRAVLLALLYESPRGRALLDIDATNERNALRALADAQDRELARLRAALAAAAARPDAWGAVNDSAWNSRSPSGRWPASTAAARGLATPAARPTLRRPAQSRLRVALRARWG
jgi:hypothetical protein